MVESDLNVRAGVIFTDGKMCLIGHAPNKKKGPNTWDLPKGHLRDDGEDPVEGAAREFREETGVTLDINTVKLINEEPVKYNKDLFFLCMAKVSKLPPLEQFHCISYFDWYGKRLPEVSEYKYVKIEELCDWIYKGLADVIKPLIQNIVDKTSDFTKEEELIQESTVYLSFEKLKNFK